MAKQDQDEAKRKQTWALLKEIERKDKLKAKQESDPANPAPPAIAENPAPSQPEAPPAPPQIPMEMDKKHSFAQDESFGIWRDRGIDVDKCPLMMFVALEFLAMGETVTESARQAGVHRNTLHRWLRNPVIGDAVSRAQDENLLTIRARLISYSERALLSIEEALERGNPRLALQLLKSLGAFDPRPASDPDSPRYVEGRKALDSNLFKKVLAPKQSDRPLRREVDRYPPGMTCAPLTTTPENPLKNVQQVQHSDPQKKGSGGKPTIIFGTMLLVYAATWDAGDARRQSRAFGPEEQRTKVEAGIGAETGALAFRRGATDGKRGCADERDGPKEKDLRPVVVSPYTTMSAEERT